MSLAKLKIKVLDTGQEFISEPETFEFLKEKVQTIYNDSLNSKSAEILLETGGLVFIPIGFIKTQCIVEIVHHHGTKKKFDEEWMEEVYKVAHSPASSHSLFNPKVEAIKVCRRLTGMSLHDSRKKVEELMRL